ncbi:MAG TPA: 6-carboxytetrahydropterin synthase [Anaerolineales bacterium]|nr:6-carboxytetrahydropterin synthase [Anaerolineales bacterium]HLE72872.1 6-carboxytetrahydropterin synthase [Anaerolineales bacterium]
MYTLALRRSFEARHHLIGGDWGAENEPHTHPYRVEVRLEGETLNEHGYLIDLVEVESKLDEILAAYRGADLNVLPDFAGLNPSLESFARIFCTRLADSLDGAHLLAVIVQLWESESAWASYRLET